MIKNTHNSPSLFSNLSDMLNQSYPLYQLADKIAWEKFETAFQPLYCQDNGRPGKPIHVPLQNWFISASVSVKRGLNLFFRKASV